MTIALTTNDLIVVHHKQPCTTSLKVAEAFGKRHTHVLRKVQELDCSEEFTSAHFWAYDQEMTIGNGAKRKSKVYEMTKDGFMFLVMGFTGKKAAQVKEAYINAFNEMAEKLYGKPAPSRRKQKALPNGLSVEQQDAIKGLVKARVEALTPDRRAKAAITCWSALKSKFGCTYKEIPPENFTEAASLVARVALEGEYIEADKPAPAIGLDEISALTCVLAHCRAMERDFNQIIGPAIKPLNMAVYHNFREHIFVASSQTRSLAERLQKRVGPNLLA